MNVFLAGTQVNLAIPLLDDAGNAITPTSAKYRVVDQDGVEVMAETDLTVGAEATEVVAVVAGEDNALATGVVRGMRVVEVHAVVEGNTVLLSGAYVIQSGDPLQVGFNSFQTYPQAQFAAMNIATLDGWNGATDQQRMSALIEARHNICQLSFVTLNSQRGQDALDYVPEGANPTPTINLFAFSGDLSELNEAQFSRLPAKMIAALRMAQVAEADALLGGDPEETKRQKGLLVDQIGESRQMFRDGKPLQLPVSRRALKYLSLWITMSKKIGRA